MTQTPRPLIHECFELGGEEEQNRPGEVCERLPHVRFRANVLTDIIIRVCNYHSKTVRGKFPQ